MGIIGEYPEGGVRFDLARTTAGAPWVYEGTASTAGDHHALRATVDAEGRVTVEGAERLPDGLAVRAELLLRTAYRHGRDGTPDGAPPHRIRRWRAG